MAEQNSTGYEIVGTKTIFL